MARPNRPRSIEGESNLARRIQREREYRGLSYEALAKTMTDAGCSIQGSAIYKIEKGDPPRRITVDELVAFARVFDVEVENLLTPVEVLRTKRGKQLLKDLEDADRALLDSMSRLTNGYLEWFDLAAFEPDLREYVDNHRFRKKLSDEVVEHMSLGSLVVDGRQVDFDATMIRDALLAFYLAIIELAGGLSSTAIAESQRGSDDG